MHLHFHIVIFLKKHKY